MLSDPGYLRSVTGHLQVVVPVFTLAETGMREAVFGLLKPIVLDWLTANCGLLQRRLAPLTPVRHGAPFGEVMTQVWHYLFGLTNQAQVKAGLFHDPYGPEAAHRGFLPYVYPKAWDVGAV